MMPFRLTSISRRVWWSAFIIVGAALLVTVIFSDPNGTQPANIALMSVLRSVGGACGRRLSSPPRAG